MLAVHLTGAVAIVVVAVVIGMMIMFMILLRRRIIALLVWMLEGIMELCAGCRMSKCKGSTWLDEFLGSAQYDRLHVEETLLEKGGEYDTRVLVVECLFAGNHQTDCIVLDHVSNTF